MHHLLVHWEDLKKFVCLKEGESLETKCLSVFDLDPDVHKLTFQIYMDHFKMYADFDMRDLPAKAMLKMMVSVLVDTETEETQFTPPELFEDSQLTNKLPMQKK